MRNSQIAKHDSAASTACRSSLIWSCGSIALSAYSRRMAGCAFSPGSLVDFSVDGKRGNSTQKCVCEICTLHTFRGPAVAPRAPVADFPRSLSCTIKSRQRCGGVEVHTPNQEDSANTGCSDFPQPRDTRLSQHLRDRGSFAPRLPLRNGESGQGEKLVAVLGET